MDILSKLNYIKRGLMPYSKWIGKTSSERELINAMKIALEKLETVIEEVENLEEPDADIPGDFGTHQYHDIG